MMWDIMLSLSLFTFFFDSFNNSFPQLLMIPSYLCSTSGLSIILLYNDFNCLRLSSKLSGNLTFSSLQGQVTWYLPSTFVIVSVKCLNTPSLSSTLSAGVIPIVSNFQNSPMLGGVCSIESSEVNW